MPLSRAVVLLQTVAALLAVAGLGVESLTAGPMLAAARAHVEAPTEEGTDLPPAPSQPALESEEEQEQKRGRGRLLVAAPEVMGVPEASGSRQRRPSWGRWTNAGRIAPRAQPRAPPSI